MNDIIQRMKQPLPVAMLGAGFALGILVAFFVFRTEEPVDRNAKYYDVQLQKGMDIYNLKTRFGEPDTIGESGWVWNKEGEPNRGHDEPPRFGEKNNKVVEVDTISGGGGKKWVNSNEWDRSSWKGPEYEYKYFYQHLQYGAFGAHDQQQGHVTKHRLSLEFIDSRLIRWEKTTPLGSN